VDSGSRRYHGSAGTTRRDIGMNRSSSDTALAKRAEEGAGRAVLNVAGLRTYFFTRLGIIKAVDDLSFTLRPRETLAIVGESGCGKSMTALSVMRLIPEPPGRIVGGSIELDGRDLLKLDEAQMRAVRGNDISMIFQEPMTSLNPVLTIGAQISETARLHQDLTKSAAWEKAVEMLRRVRIPEPAQRANEYPHQLSGGMRQRAMIAMALACNPKVLIADEPTTALDVTIQAQILDLMLALQEEFRTAIILITHDLAVVAQTSQKIIVIYAWAAGVDSAPDQHGRRATRNSGTAQGDSGRRAAALPPSRGLCLRAPLP